MCAYANTPNKATIRRCWDQPILERWYARIGKPLSYFGLPGPEIHDFLDWRHLLGIRTGIESPGHTKKERKQADETIGQLNANIMFNGLSSGFQLLRADVEDVILDAIDSYGTPPQMNDGQPAHKSHFGYDIINLDFDGGIGYRDSNGAAKRVAAIKKLFERQEGHSFVLFLTINVRDTMGDEIENYLRGLQARERGPNWYETIDWYLSRSDGEREYKLKAIIPSFIHAVAEPRVFQCLSRPPIAYIGHKQAHMVHFAFELEAATSNGRLINLRGFSPQDDPDLIELPLLRCENGQLRLTEKQHPKFDYASCRRNLDFLSEAICESILAPVQSRIFRET